MILWPKQHLHRHFSSEPNLLGAELLDSFAHDSVGGFGRLFALLMLIDSPIAIFLVSCPGS